MFKIGEFSKICQVSVKALRHCDEMGLLKPAYSDSVTGYRYYGIDQLRTVNRILTFRGMNLSLTQVIRLLQEDLPASEIRGMLRLKQAELQQKIEEGQQALQMVEARLKLIEEEGMSPQIRYEPEADSPAACPVHPRGNTHSIRDDRIPPGSAHLYQK